MNINIFDFDLPQELIAQTPIENRQNSKMMVVDRKKNTVDHKNFYNIVDYFQSGDVLVLNNTRVFYARINGFNVDSGGKMEFLLLKNLEKNVWEVMCKPGKRALVGRTFSFGNGKLLGKVIDIKSCGNRIVEFEFEGDFYELLNEIGNIPLPPYIKSKLNDSERYQTIYSDKIGSIAAPTAGLHFTNELMEKIKSKGVKIVYVTLHVGMGTFMPVKVENVEDHKMHSEYFEISKETCDIINSCKVNGGKVIAVGTTSMRVLETVGSRSNDGYLYECFGETDIFIKPGYEFKIVDSLVTNFHLPKSTLVILVSAFYNKDKIMELYNEAIVNKYRFFSFGDSMLLL